MLQRIGVGLAVVLSTVALAVSTWGSFTASPVPWDGTYEAQPANSDPVSQGAAHLRQAKGETSRRGGVEHDWGTFGNVTTDRGRHLAGSARAFLQSAAPAVDGTTAALCLPELDTAGLRFCEGGRLWLDSDDNQLYVSTDAGADGDADAWQPVGGIGLQTVWVPASGIFPETTGGAAFPIQTEFDTDSPEAVSVDFDGASSECAQLPIGFPKKWDTGTLTARFFYFVSANVGTTVRWTLDGYRITDGESFIALAFGTAQGVTDTYGGTSNTLAVTAYTSAVTLAGSASDDALTALRVCRDTAVDTTVQDARLLGLQLRYTASAATDN